MKFDLSKKKKIPSLKEKIREEKSLEVVAWLKK